MGFIAGKTRYTVKDYKNARDIALFVLFEVCEERHKSNAILKEVFEDADRHDARLSTTDRAFAERIVIGTLDRLITLDAVLGTFLKKGMNRQKPLIRAVLRMSAYQLMYMDRVPQSAACNEGVKLVRLHGMDGMSGLVNGVLRSLARELEACGKQSQHGNAELASRAETTGDSRIVQIKSGRDAGLYQSEHAGETGTDQHKQAPDLADALIKKLGLGNDASVRYSLPEWICSLLGREYGAEQADVICSAFLKDRRETLRFNISRVIADGKVSAAAAAPGNTSDNIMGTAAEPAGDHESSNKVSKSAEPACTRDMGDAVRAAAERYIVESLQDDGFETKAIDMKALAETSVYSDMPEAAFPVMYVLNSGGDIAASEAFRRGYVTVQDPASAFTASFAAPKSGDHIIDVCAAPGGKSLAIAELMADDCRIEARDVSERKTALIEENVRRCRYSNIHVRVLDALKPDEDSLYRADVLIADLPCSGLGVIAKKPDIKFNLEPYTVNELQQLQRDILMNVTSFIKPKGRLVYSTCTLSREENEDNTEWLISELGFKKLKEFKLLPGDDNDGFYIAVLQKRYG